MDESVEERCRSRLDSRVLWGISDGSVRPSYCGFEKWEALYSGRFDWVGVL